MKKFILLSLITFVGFFAQAHLGGGGEVGNGGDRGTKDYVAWFANSKRTIKACTQTAANFGMSESNAQKEILAAFQSWIQYIQAKNLNANLYDTDASYGFSSKLIFQKSCDGKQDITFFLGTQNPQVVQALRAFKDPVSFASLSSYDLRTRMGKGFIWVKAGQAETDLSGKYFPVWSVPNLFQAVILHELGHVFGLPHVPYTIMTADFIDRISSIPYNLMIVKQAGATDLTNYLADMKRKLLSVDRQKELLFCETCEHVYRTNNMGFAMAEGFEVLFGRKVQGKHECSLTWSQDRPVLDLTCTDELGTVHASIVQIVNSMRQVASEQEIFRRRWVDADKQEAGSYDLTNLGIIGMGYLQNTGAGVQILVNFHALTPIKISMVHDGQAVTIFSADPSFQSNE